MLSIHRIRKEYVTGDLTQVALDGVDLSLRDNEFVAILGPSGSGKTTLLNIIGGLDQYDSGDLIINGISTKKYSDRDWDSYRNHSVGFVFQSYNLIPHQSILANVELALTISGISKKERRQRAQDALSQVGLGDQVHKRPNQLSGGQMQRVAIARALVNNPEVLLADEPTGALDTQTSRQIMDLLKEVAQDRLVVMVTHNPELAEEYANRVVRLRDGQIVSDTNPHPLDSDSAGKAKHKNMGKSSMSFLTALSLSFNNLRTKKGRTILTAFAGSIGIIGIALVLSISTGANTYIESIQKETMASYPISIEAQTIDLSSMIEAGNAEANAEVNHDLNGIYSNPSGIEKASKASASITENNLTPFKEYLDDPNSPINQYIGENGIVYSYPVDFDIYSHDQDGTLVNADGSTFDEEDSDSSAMVGMASMGGMGSFSSFSATTSNGFDELIPAANGDSISKVISDNYEVVAGNWPKEYNELVLVLDENNEVPLSTLYQLGMLPAEEYKEILKKVDDGEEITLDDHSWNYDEVLGTNFQMLTASDYYQKADNGDFELIEGTDSIENLLSDSLELTVVGVIRSTADSTDNPISGNVGYTNKLTEYIIDHTNQSAVVTAQEASPEVNVLNGVKFSTHDDADKVQETISYLQKMSVADKADLSRSLLFGSSDENAESQANMAVAAAMTEAQLAESFDEYLAGEPDQELLLTIYDTQISPGTYDENLSDFGVVSLDSPSQIDLYADSFEDKDEITAAIADYNETASTENQIVYTDYVGLLMSTVTTIINVISYVLIAFVAVSLVVSSIMIGIITFISVLERTKEIGVLRAIGASKRNISQVFNAETLIVGLLAGIFGIGIASLLLIPGNAIIHSVTGVDNINLILPWGAALALIALSTLLTFIAGLIPARSAAKKDPVLALRSE